MKIYLVAGYMEYLNWIPEAQISLTLDDADLVLFEGGADVDPSVYNEPKGKYTGSDLSRDKSEIAIFNKAKELGKPMLGICRGSQFLCVMAGGRLIQHQNNPSFIHDMKTLDRKTIKVSSTHHQAQFPFELPKEDYKLIGWSEGLVDFHLDGDEQEMNPKKDAEVVYYPKINALGIQPHPEMLYSSLNKAADEGFEETIEWFRDTLTKFLNKEL